MADDPLTIEQRRALDEFVATLTPIEVDPSKRLTEPPR